ncbi:hypothetical protein [Maledivibacter halophilus]|uniref:DUF7973 domain-containing protein n=1 Tax=Maledivibacter halophilus TaxID=36842 RepID=A0A1T5JV95_9FIRM|nr:hypothetical protein [Maledivibacter halophilus]SKC55301.1 hypothetical protein SAMN02194393_01371 [Maledivibacter halophilus]
MTLELILAAFGGGLLGAVIGALPAFIFTGFIGLVGVAVIAAGGPEIILNDITFGALFGPHIAFAGGVAAAAYAANKKKVLDSGMNTLIPLSKYRDAGILIVGGVFGVLGLGINYLYSTILVLQTDTIAMTVVTSGIIARLVFGNTGLFGKMIPADDEVAAASELNRRRYFPDLKTLGLNIIIGLGLGLVVSYVVILTNIGPFGFCVSAASLMFAQMGFSIPATHHITLVAGLAAIATGNIFIGAAFAILSAILFEIAALIFNSNCDSHIDPPATAIFICAFIIFAVF